jgi:hypothetical protein
MQCPFNVGLHCTYITLSDVSEVLKLWSCTYYIIIVAPAVVLRVFIKTITLKIRVYHLFHRVSLTVGCNPILHAQPLPPWSMDASLNRRDDYYSIPSLYAHKYTLYTVLKYIYIYIYIHDVQRYCSLCARAWMCACVCAQGPTFRGSNCSLDRVDRRVGPGGWYNSRHKGLFGRIYTFFFPLPPLHFSRTTTLIVRAVEKKGFLKHIHIHAYNMHAIYARITRSIRIHNSRRNKNRSRGVFLVRVCIHNTHTHTHTHKYIYIIRTGVSLYNIYRVCYTPYKYTLYMRVSVRVLTPIALSLRVHVVNIIYARMCCKRCEKKIPR